ncbi:MAG: hypothetical protein M1839_000070 [Geoglossum umbratile]|nr:MAG: hypothetical protein M1839_000070 [Geoglossum umbratile]
MNTKTEQRRRTLSLKQHRQHMKQKQEEEGFAGEVEDGAVGVDGNVDVDGKGEAGRIKRIMRKVEGKLGLK